jgi:hypothetical protein
MISHQTTLLVVSMAILAWQGVNRRSETGFLGDADAIALAGAAPQATEPRDASRSDSHGGVDVIETAPADVPRVDAAQAPGVAPSTGEPPAPEHAETTPTAPPPAPAEPAQQASADQSGESSSPSPELPILLIAALVVVGVKRVLTESVMKAVYATVTQHKRALVRRRFQTLRHDDYGNLLVEPWQKELSYFRFAGKRAIRGRDFRTAREKDRRRLWSILFSQLAYFGERHRRVESPPWERRAISRLQAPSHPPKSTGGSPWHAGSQPSPSRPFDASNPRRVRIRGYLGDT